MNKYSEISLIFHRACDWECKCCSLRDHNNKTIDFNLIDSNSLINLLKMLKKNSLIDNQLSICLSNSMDLIKLNYIDLFNFLENVSKKSEINFTIKILTALSKDSEQNTKIINYFSKFKSNNIKINIFDIHIFDENIDKIIEQINNLKKINNNIKTIFHTTGIPSNFLKEKCIKYNIKYEERKIFYKSDIKIAGEEDLNCKNQIVINYDTDNKGTIFRFKHCESKDFKCRYDFVDIKVKDVTEDYLINVLNHKCCSIKKYKCVNNVFKISEGIL